MEKEEELDNKIISQITRREQTNSALKKILENINTNHAESNKVGRGKSLMNIIQCIFPKRKKVQY